MRELLLTFAVCAAALAQSSGSLTGVVTDASGSPVANARIWLTDSASTGRRAASTGVRGDFRFEDLRAAEYIVEAQAEGFGATPPRRLRIEGPLEIHLTLEIARVMTEVQVTAASLVQTVDEQSKALDVISSSQMERRAEFSVAEALRTVPGLKVQQLGGPGTFTRVITRGMRATDTSILVDGFRLRDAASPQADATAFTGDLLIANTDRIEVLRGSGSSLYGTHATGGVVNLITDQGGGPLRGGMTVEGGGLGLFRNSARFSGGGWKDRVRFAGGASHLNVTRGVDGDDRARNTTGHGFVQLQISPGSILSARVLAADSFVQLNDTPYALGALPAGTTVRAIPNVTLVPSPNDPDARRSGVNTNTLIAFSRYWSPAVSTRLAWSGVTTHRDNRDGPAGTRFEPLYSDSNRFDGRIDTIQARTDFQFYPQHLLTAGYEFERETYDNVSRDEDPNPLTRIDARLQIEQSSHGGFAQLQGRYLEGRLQALLSGRIQRFSLTRPTFSGNSSLYRAISLPDPPIARTGDVSVSWLARPGTKIRSHLGNGYRAPALFERFGASFFAGAFSAYGDPALRPERLLSFDAGVDQYLAASRLRVSGTYFYTRIQESIIFDFSGAILPATDPYSRFGGYRNTGGGLARGVELSVESNPVRTLTFQGSYTYTNADDRFSQFSNGLLRAVRVSDHMFTATASQRIGRRIDVTFDAFAASNYVVPFSGRAMEFDGPVKADIVASYTHPLSDRHSLRLYTRIENILNRSYLEEGFRTPGAWAAAGLKWLF